MQNTSPAIDIIDAGCSHQLVLMSSAGIGYSFCSEFDMGESL